MRHRNDDVLFLDQIFHVDLAVIVGKFRLAFARIIFLDDGKVCLDDVEHALLVGENIFQVGNGALQFGEFFLQFFHFEGSEALQAHFQDRVRLFVRKFKRFHQALRGDVFIRRLLDDGDDFVDVCQRQDKPCHDMRALFRLVQIEARAAHDDVFLVFDIIMDALLEVEDFRLAVHKRKEDDPVGSLQLGMFVQRVQHDLRIGVLAELDDDAHTVPVRFFADVGNAFHPFVFDEVGNIFNEARLVDLIRDLADDDAGARRVAGGKVLYFALCAQDVIASPVR